MELLTPLTVTSNMCEVIHKLMFIDSSLLADSIVHIEWPKSDSEGYTCFFVQLLVGSGSKAYISNSSVIS